MSTTAKLSLAEYEKIVASGVFDWPNQRHIELIHGELRDMNPIGPDHALVVARLTQWSVLRCPPELIQVRVQSPLAIADAESEPQPDIAWARETDYFQRHPAPDDVLLVIEVAESSVERDRTEKFGLYASAGIREYWIVNLIDRTIEVYRDPMSGVYQTTQIFAADETVFPLAMPKVGLSFDRLLFPFG